MPCSRRRLLRKDRSLRRLSLLNVQRLVFNCVMKLLSQESCFVDLIVEKPLSSSCLDSSAPGGTSSCWDPLDCSWRVIAPDHVVSDPVVRPARAFAVVPLFVGELRGDQAALEAPVLTLWASDRERIHDEHFGIAVHRDDRVYGQAIPHVCNLVTPLEGSQVELLVKLCHDPERIERFPDVFLRLAHLSSPLDLSVPGCSEALHCSIFSRIDRDLLTM